MTCAPGWVVRDQYKSLAVNNHSIIFTVQHTTIICTLLYAVDNIIHVWKKANQSTADCITEKKRLYYPKIMNHDCSWRLIESNTGDRSRSRNLRHPRVRFQSFSHEACPSQGMIEILPEGVWDFSILTCHQCLIIFFTQASP